MVKMKHLSNAETNARQCISLLKAFMTWFLDKAGTFPVITEPSIVRPIISLQKKIYCIKWELNGEVVSVLRIWSPKLFSALEQNLRLYDLERTDMYHSTDNTVSSIKFNWNPLRALLNSVHGTTDRRIWNPHYALFLITLKRNCPGNVPTLLM